MKNPISNGIRYYIDTDEKTQWKGFGGRKFTIIFNDGEIIKTSNLWYSMPTDEKDNCQLFDGWDNIGSKVGFKKIGNPNAIYQFCFDRIG